MSPTRLVRSTDQHLTDPAPLQRRLRESRASAQALPPGQILGERCFEGRIIGCLVVQALTKEVKTPPILFDHLGPNGGEPA